MIVCLNCVNVSRGSTIIMGTRATNNNKILMKFGTNVCMGPVVRLKESCQIVTPNFIRLNNFLWWLCRGLR